MAMLSQAGPTVSHSVAVSTLIGIHAWMYVFFCPRVL